MREPVGLKCEALVKSYGDRPVINGLDLTIHPAELSVVLGPSGAGKTTLLRCLSGLTQPTAGRVLIDGAPITGVADDVAVVFQDYSRSLYPWMTLEKNVRFGLRSLNRRQARAKALEALERVGLSDSTQLYPWQISGGMQQRTAIARALAVEAPLLIMDEPFASVDALTKIHLEQLLLQVWGETPFTCIFVTHDIEEAVYLADRLFVLSHRPSQLRQEFVVDLPRPRDQLATKALPRFHEIRKAAFELIEGTGKAASPAIQPAERGH